VPRQEEGELLAGDIRALDHPDVLRAHLEPHLDGAAVITFPAGVLAVSAPGRKYASLVKPSAWTRPCVVVGVFVIQAPCTARHRAGSCSSYEDLLCKAAREELDLALTKTYVSAS